MTDEEAREFCKDPANLVPAGPARKPLRPGKTAMVAVRFDPAAIDAVRRIADGTGQTVSSWIRSAVQRELDRRAPQRPTGIIPGSGRLGEPKGFRSPLTLGILTGTTGAGRTFSCEHMSIGNVENASCGTCGPLTAVA